MDTEQMIERARIVALSPSWQGDREWAEALLAEHDARVAAEQERDEAQLAAAGQVLLTNREARRVATLEAALRNLFGAIDRQPYDVGIYLAAVKAARAALGDQAAPTESMRVIGRITLMG
jgi:hypothetical protein